MRLTIWNHHSHLFWIFLFVYRKVLDQPIQYINQPDYALTAPLVKPLINWRIATTNTNSSGMDEIT